MFVRSNWMEVQILGTAVIIGSYVALTARHVLEASFRFAKLEKASGGNFVVDGGELLLLQVLPGPNYRYWQVEREWMTSSDIAILHLKLRSPFEETVRIDWRCLALRATPPPKGEKVVAFGYRESVVSSTERPDGQAHLEINDKPTTSA